MAVSFLGGVRFCLGRVWGWGLGGADRGECGAGAWAVLRAASVDGVLRAASVGIALSPPASVVVLHK